MSWSQLKGASITGLGVNLGAQWIRFAVQLGYQVALARLLAPRDFGLVALTAPVIAFVQLFADLGLSQATVQKQEIDEDQLSFIFWMNALAGLVLAVVVIAASPLVGWFYGDRRVVVVTAASGALFLVGGLYAQHLAILNRHMRFKSLAAIDVISLTTGAVAGLAAAAFHLHYWALVLGQAVMSTTSLALAWAISRWRPRIPRNVQGMRSLLGFGANLTGFNFFNYFARNLDNVLIGRFCGEQSLGFYDRAYKLLLLPIQQVSGPLTRLAVPLLSRCQTDPPRYRQAYVGMLMTILLLTYPGVLFALIFSKPLILFALGPKWSEVSTISSILIVSAFSAAIGNTSGWLFISQGRTREMRNLGVVTSSVYVVAFVVGLPWGPVGVASCYAAMALASLPLLMVVATQSGPVRLTDVGGALFPFLVAALVSAPVLLLIRLAAIPVWAELISGSILSYVIQVAALNLTKNGRGMLRTAYTNIAPKLAFLRAAPSEAILSVSEDATLKL